MKKTKIKFNPFSAKSILWAVILAALAFQEGKEAEYVPAVKTKDPSDPLGSWKKQNLHLKVGSEKQKSPLLVHAIFNDDWKKEETENVSFGFVCTYMELDADKAAEIQKKYLQENGRVDDLVAKGKVLRNHPMQKLWDDAKTRNSLLAVSEEEEGDGGEEGDGAEGGEKTDKV